MFGNEFLVIEVMSDMYEGICDSTFSLEVTCRKEEKPSPCNLSSQIKT